MKANRRARKKARRKRVDTAISRILVVMAGIAGLALAVFIVKQGELGRLLARRAVRSESAEGETPFLIQGLDRDGDQRVSWREFHVFDRIDRNGDGFVDADEASARTQAKRPRRRGDQ
ncbi:MAG: hypothetical protein CME06_02020 [Gemmatimonadetes bacterium]|nr:hypothetical protein [Gemmatimonadota bacterium]